MTRCLGLLLLLITGGPVVGDTGSWARLPLPVEGPEGSLTFETRGPPATVLTGLELPSEGPLTSWAPVFSTLEPDGTLREATPGAWSGVVPPRWQKWSRPGFVVAGFRVLVKIAPTPLQIQQIQIFWRPWSNGSPAGALVESRPLGVAALGSDTIKIVEITLPEAAIPTGLYGQTLGGKVVQCSLIIKPGSSAPPSPASTTSPIQGPFGPKGPRVLAPAAPQASKLPN